MTSLDVLAGGLDGHRLLGDEDHVRAAGNAAHDRDPACMSAHHLDDHDAVVRLRGRVQPVDGLGRDPDGRVEAEGVVGRREVVVDRLGHADDRKLLLCMQPGGYSQSVFAADRNEGTKAFAPEVVEHAGQVALLLVRVRARRAEDGSAPGQDSGDLARAEGLELSLDEPTPAFPDSDDLRTLLQGAPGDRPDDRVQAGAVAPTRQDADALWPRRLTSPLECRLGAQRFRGFIHDSEGGRWDAEGGDRTRTGPSPTGF